jgi:hypothetical protein
MFEHEFSQLQNSLTKCYNLLDNSNNDQSLQSSLSFQAQNIYSKLEVHHQQIYQFEKLIGFESTQLQIEQSTFSLIPHFLQTIQQWFQKLQSL